VGLTGLGGLGRGVIYGYIANLFPETEITSLCDIDPAVLEYGKMTFGLNDSDCYRDYDQFVKRPDTDIIFVGTPIEAHAEQSIKALEAGKNVLSELTASNTVEGCKRLVHAVKQSGMKYMMAENFRYFHFIQQWIDIVQQGKLGEIVYAETDSMDQLKSYLRDPKTGKVAWKARRPPIHYSSHSLGPILSLFNDRIVRAMSVGNGSEILPDVRPGGIDAQVALFETSRGKIIKLLRSQVISRTIIFYSLYGTRGFLETGRDSEAGISETTRGLRYIEGEEKEPRHVEWSYVDPEILKHYSDIPNPDQETHGGIHTTCEYSVFADFLGSILNDAKPPVDVVKAADWTLPGLIAYDSSLDSNRWLEVPHFE
jgi:predicted dehydrogenase